MSLNKPIGGYFELETNDFGSVYHEDAIALNSGRNALEYILLVNNYKKIYLPFYTCDVLLQPIKKLDIDFEFYYLDKEFLPKIDTIENNAVLLYVNYYGLMDDNIEALQTKYSNLIVDNAQAFYSQPINEIPTFYSPRKFFGLPDGGFVYSNTKLKANLEFDKSSKRMSHLVVRIEDGAEAGFNLFQQNEDELNNLPLRKMSKLTDKLLKNIDFDSVRKKRNENFNILHQALKNENELTPIIENTTINGPMIYPYLKKGNDKLRSSLISKKIFVANYWPNVSDWLGGKECYESYLQSNLIPLPIDQRYGLNELSVIIKNIV